PYSIPESIAGNIREQLAQAVALEQAGRLDEADRLRVRVALENQTMLMGTGVLAASLPRLARNVVTSRALTRDELIAGLPQGTKITPENVVDIRRLPDGRTVWLETGSDAAGLQHIYNRHEVDFSNKGIPREEIPAVIMNALERGDVVGTNGSASVYRIRHNGIEQNIAIGIGSNGFVVRANPVSYWRPLP
ncbi:hypothetical protein ACUY1T_21985, partial [Billgrantia sp. Q4P2]|uniref:hypothetical protein n=1 Tax=Billgrantia sp. Q4P2 TaxID=3463857 RepID=UPI004055C2C8